MLQLGTKVAGRGSVVGRNATSGQGRRCTKAQLQTSPEVALLGYVFTGAKKEDCSSLMPSAQAQNRRINVPKFLIGQSRFCIVKRGR